MDEHAEFKIGQKVMYSGQGPMWPMWVREDLGDGVYKLFSHGEWVTANACDMEPIDTNPHPGYKHYPGFCENCGY